MMVYAPQTAFGTVDNLKVPHLPKPAATVLGYFERNCNLLDLWALPPRGANAILRGIRDPCDYGGISQLVLAALDMDMDMVYKLKWKWKYLGRKGWNDVRSAPRPMRF